MVLAEHQPAPAAAAQVRPRQAVREPGCLGPVRIDGAQTRWDERGIVELPTRPMSSPPDMLQFNAFEEHSQQAQPAALPVRLDVRRVNLFRHG